MDSTNIDKKFFSLYERGGMVDKCIYYVQSNDKGLNVLVFWTYYDELPKQYRANEEYIRAMMYSGSSPLIDKIEADLEKCTNQQETERCIFRLLTPFKRLADMLNDSKFVELLNSNSTDDVVCVLVNMTRAFYTYANRLYAMLIQHGIDLMQYQRRANIYLKRQWSVADIEPYIGSRELAEYYLNQLPYEQQPITGQPFTRHFNSKLSEAELTAKLTALKGNCLPDDFNLQGWLWFCTGKIGTQPTEPLKWDAEQNKLGVFADWICEPYRKTTDWQTVKAGIVCKDVETGNYVEPNIDAIRQRKIADDEKTKLLNLLKTTTARKEK